jgi:hypothetical protein
MSPAPAVQALCYIPRIHHSEWVDFMIDTGASVTCLNGIYSLGLEQYKRTSTIRRSTGISGSCDYFYEDALLIFMDTRRQQVAESIKLGIQCIPTNNRNDPDWLHCPCLLGRDIINKYLFTYDTQNDRVTLEMGS